MRKEKSSRRKLIAALSVCGIPATTSIWSKPIVNSIALPAHAMTSAPIIPFQLERVWLARYVNRSAAFRFTINSDGSATFFQQILTFGGIPINRIDRLELESVSLGLREISWTSDNTRIVVTYSESFDSLSGTDQPARGRPSEFVATPI